MAEAGNCRQSTLLSTKDSHARNRSTERISPHSIESKSQDMILSRMQKGGLPLSISHVALSRHGKSLSICTNQLGDRRTTLETPAFSQRDNNTPTVEVIDERSARPTHRQLHITNHHVYELLESIKIMPVRNGKREQLVKTIREGLQHLQEEPEIRTEVESIQGILSKIQCKLKNEPYRSKQATSKQPLSLSEISPIRKLSPPKSSKVLYTNLNLQMFCDDVSATEPSVIKPTHTNVQELSSVDNNIEYYKIMHMLGEKYEITPKKSERCSQRKKQSASHRKEELNESVRISQLNLQLQMLQNMLQTKKKLLPKAPTPSKSVRDILSMKRRTMNSKQNSNIQSRLSSRKQSRPLF